MFSQKFSSILKGKLTQPKFALIVFINEEIELNKTGYQECIKLNDTRCDSQWTFHEKEEKEIHTYHLRHKNLKKDVQCKYTTYSGDYIAVNT